MAKQINPYFIKENIAPYAAHHIGVYNDKNEKVGDISISSIKPEYGKRQYRFGLLSDVHNQSSQTSENTADLQNALSVFNEKESVKITCICGDISQNATTTEFQLYKDNVAAKSPKTTVFTTTGNHDCPSSGAFNDAQWSGYTGTKKSFYFTNLTTDGVFDVFIFFGLTNWSLGDSGTPYSEEDIAWLENLLETYKNNRVFIFTHLFFPTKAGNLNNIYPSGNWLGGSQLARIQALNEKYVNSIWFSGHSHWKWYLQKYQDRANIYRSYDADGKPTCGYCVHVPSCASPIDSDGSSRLECGKNSNEVCEQSEGAIVDVYENYIDIRGVTFKDYDDEDYVTRYLPIATYRLDTTIIDLTESNNITELEGANNWELGSIDSSTGGEQEWSVDVNGIRTADRIAIDGANRYYLSVYEGIGSAQEDYLCEFSICLYDKSGNYLGRPEGLNSGTTGGATGKYYFDAILTRFDITDKITCYNGTEVGYVRFKTYKQDKTTAITADYGDRIYIEYEPNGNTEWNGCNGSSTGSTTGSTTGTTPTVECDYLTASNFSVQTNKSGATVTNSSDEGYVEVVFSGRSQGFWISANCLDASATSATLVLEDVSYYTGRSASNVTTQVTTRTNANTQKIGFYTTNSSYTMTNGATLSTTESGANGRVQFQTSSSAILYGATSGWTSGRYAKVKMKVKIQYNK